MTRFVPVLFAAAALSAAESIHEFSARAADGKDQPLSAYNGKVVLIVNTASK